MKSTFVKSCAALLMIASILSLVGCSQDNDRKPTPAEISQADKTRLDTIDKLNVPESQKEQMRAHMGGPPASNPADAARQKASSTGRR
jgi:outer membrane protein assembly factor BamE (lipoprotein component of BamABCDE complex)